MNIQRVLLAVSILAGLVSGPSAAESSALSQPPIGWSDLVFIFGGSLIALPLVLGFQAALGNYKAMRWGWLFFLLGAIYFVATGVSSVIVSIVSSGIAPHSFLFLAMSLGMLGGLAVVKSFWGRRFAHDT